MTDLIRFHPIKKFCSDRTTTKELLITLEKNNDNKFSYYSRSESFYMFRKSFKTCVGVPKSILAFITYEFLYIDGNSTI